MAYQSGLRNKRITVLNRQEQTVGMFGIDSAGIEWTEGPAIWANVEWSRGKAAMNVGALDAYCVVMVRMLYTNTINMRSRIRYEGQVYQILPDTFHADFETNTIQFHAQLVQAGAEYSDDYNNDFNSKQYGNI